MSVLEVNDGNFEAEVLQSELPVLVEFGAQWCGPCKRQAPILEQFAVTNLGKVKVVTLDSDVSPETTKKYEVKGLPSILLFSKGQKLTAKVGLTSLASLTILVDSNLSF